MADDTQTTPEAPTPEFTHQISAKQYLEGLKAEYATASTKTHKDAVKAEIEALLASQGA